MINSHQMHERDSFETEHGPFVLVDGFKLFSDAALVEDNPMGRMISPPEDKYERLKLVARYWQLAAQTDEEAFDEFKTYLGGTGRRQDAWATLYTEEDRIAHLKTLQQQAKRSRAKYMKAKREAKAATPFWVEERDAQEIDEQRRNEEFLQQVDQIQL